MKKKYFFHEMNSLILYANIVWGLKIIETRRRRRPECRKKKQNAEMLFSMNGSVRSTRAPGVDRVGRVKCLKQFKERERKITY